MAYSELLWGYSYMDLRVCLCVSILLCVFLLRIQQDYRSRVLLYSLASLSSEEYVNHSH